MTPSVLADLLQAADPTPAEPRRPGRPRTRTPAYFRALLDDHAQAVAWFAGQHGRPPRSDRELLTAWCAAELAARGRREARTTAPAFERRMKTIRNDLAIARRAAQTVP